MQSLKVLVLTDHTHHSAENSLYALVRAMRAHARCAQLDVATRGAGQNAAFFQGQSGTSIDVYRTSADFQYDAQGRSLTTHLERVATDTYDMVWLRLPPPLSSDFLRFVARVFARKVVINDPEGIHTSGSKAFMLRFQELCAPMQRCDTIAAIEQFKARFPIVLKPYRAYGGQGLVRIDGDRVWRGNEATTWAQFKESLATRESLGYLGVKYLEHVDQGDKRIVVVNGRIMGASLRLPASDSWLCNVAMGGTSNPAEVDDDERHIVATIDPILRQLGIVMYGVDTLMGDDGRRVLSEINTTSIGGLPQIAALRNEPLVQEATDLIWQYALDRFDGVAT